MRKKINPINTMVFFTAGLLVIFFLLSLPYLFRKKTKVEPKINKKNYYEKTAFVIPPEVKKKEATASSSIRLPIIMYHYVEYVKDKGDTIRQSENINPATFEWQIKTLKEKGYQFYFAKEIPQLLKSEKIASRAAVITFDDGYRDFYTDAFPILKKYQIKSTVYVICDFIGGPNFMTEQQIKEVFDSKLVEIGDHTLTHSYLKFMPKRVIEKEVVECKKNLESLLKTKIETFAYPYGGFSQETIDVVKKASFSAAVSVIPGIIQSQNDLFYLNRIRPGIITGGDIQTILDKYTH